MRGVVELNENIGGAMRIGDGSDADLVSALLRASESDRKLIVAAIRRQVSQLRDPRHGGSQPSGPVLEGRAALEGDLRAPRR